LITVVPLALIKSLSLEGDNLLVFNSLSASEIRPDKRVAFDGRCLKREGTMLKS
jgi:hypothetical protein